MFPRGKLYNGGGANEGGKGSVGAYARCNVLMRELEESEDVLDVGFRRHSLGWPGAVGGHTHLANLHVHHPVTCPGERDKQGAQQENETSDAKKRGVQAAAIISTTVRAELGSRTPRIHIHFRSTTGNPPRGLSARSPRVDAFCGLHDGYSRFSHQGCQFLDSARNKA